MSVNDNTDLIKSNTFMQYILHTYVLMYYIHIVIWPCEHMNIKCGSLLSIMTRLGMYYTSKMFFSTNWVPWNYNHKTSTLFIGTYTIVFILPYFQSPFYITYLHIYMSMWNKLTWKHYKIAIRYIKIKYAHFLWLGKFGWLLWGKW